MAAVHPCIMQEEAGTVRFCLDCRQVITQGPFFTISPPGWERWLRQAEIERLPEGGLVVGFCKKCTDHPGGDVTASVGNVVLCGPPKEVIGIIKTVREGRVGYER